MFNIEIIDKNYKKDQILCEITIGDYKEYLTLDTRVWKINNYLKQWIEALNRFEEGKNKTILLISAGNGWVLHLNKDIVSITENIFKNNLFKNPYKYLQNQEENRPLTKKEIKNLEEEGIIYGDIEPMLFSEWKINLNDLKIFREKLIKKLNKI